MPSSLQARMMRSAISPRFAIRTFSNMEGGATFSTDPKKHLPELHRLAVLGHDFGDYSAGFRFDFIHHFHRLDNANHAVFGNRFTNIDKWRRIRGTAPITRAHHPRDNVF